MAASEESLTGAIPVAGPSFRGALASRDFSLLFFGQLSSEIGNGLVQLALPWLILSLTGSAFQLGFAYFIQFSPVLFFGLAGGVFVDRFDRRLTIMVADGIRAIAFLSVAIVYYFGTLSVEYLYAIIFIEALLANLFNPARAALLPNLVDREHLRPANSLMEVSRHIGFLVAPPVGGLLVQVLNPAAMFTADGISFALSAFTVFFIRYRQPRSRPQESSGWRNAMMLVITETGGGLATIRRNHLLQVAIILGVSLNLVVAPIQVLLPLFVTTVKHAAAGYYGALVGAFLLGTISGSLTASMSAGRFGIGKVAVASVITVGAVICIAGWPPYWWPPVFAMAIAGFAIGTLNVVQTTLLQGSTTDEERGRVSSAAYTANLGVRPVGFLIMGALAEAVDIRLLFVAVGLMALVVGFSLSRSREVLEAR